MKTKIPKDLTKDGITLCVTFCIAETFTMMLFGFLFTFEVVLFILTLAICLPTARTLLSEKPGENFLTDLFYFLIYVAYLKNTTCFKSVCARTFAFIMNNTISEKVT